MSQRDFHADLLSRETATMEARVGSYQAFHKARFEFALARCREVCPDRSANVLDVGRSYLSLELLQHYDRVTTLGFPLEPHSFTGITDAAGRQKTFAGHIDYDLNAAQQRVPDAPSEAFDLIVFAEVIEHLYTAPELTLFAMKSLMKPGGHLIVQTPNAAALHKRWNLLMGSNPYERIRVNPLNPGHFREYTRRELVAVARQLDLDVVSHEYCDYFGWTPVPGGRLTYVAFKAIVAAMPSLARGQTLILRRPSVSAS